MTGKKSGIFALAVTVLVFLAIAGSQIKDPSIADEVNYHRGAQKWFDLGPNPDQMVHSPLYLESLILWQKLLGRADTGARVWVLRSYGVVAGLLTWIIFLWGLLRLNPTLRNRRAFWIVALPGALLLFSPYFIQSSLLIDIDTSLQTTWVLLGAILIEMWDRKRGGSWGLCLLISAVFSLNLMTKELTPPILIMLWMVWGLSRRWRIPDEPARTHAIQALMGVVLSVMGFLALLALWAKLRNLPMLAPYELTLQKSSNQMSAFLPWQRWGLLRFAFLSYLPLLWLSIPFLVFLTMRIPARRLRTSFSLWAAVLVFGAYFWIVQISYYFPKYTAPVFPLLLLAWGAEENWQVGKISRKPGVIFLLLLLAVMPWIPGLDPLMITDLRREFGGWSLARHGLALLLPVLVFFWLWRVVRSREEFPALGALGLALFFLSSSVYHSTREHNTRYLYGEYGFQKTVEAIQKLKAKVSPDRPVLSTALDVHWALQKDAVLERLFLDQPTDLFTRYPILVSRTYDLEAVRHDPVWLARANAQYRCHYVLNDHGERFEWWWNPPESSMQCL